MFSFKGIGFKYFAILMALVAIAAGIYLTFFHSQGFEKTSATIVTLEEIKNDAGENTRRATVEYTVNGETLTAVLDSDSPSYKVGKSVDVLYDPKNPAVVHSGGFLGVYAMAVGVLLLAGVAVTEARKRKALQTVKARQEEDGGNEYPPSIPGPERRLYFVTDLGTVKGGHRIEDAGRNVLYEAKMTKFTMTAPFGFDFIDHEHGKTTPHLVGHEETTDWGNSLLLDNHYTFSFDGQDIWKHLKNNGITVESSLTGGIRTQYRILRDGREIALAESSSQNVHEEDAEAKSKLASLAPVRGFYRVTTAETDLSLLFVALLAFARSGATDDRGGNFKTLANTLNKL